MPLLPSCGIDERQRVSNAYKAVRMWEKEGQAGHHRAQRPFWKEEQTALAQCGASEEDDNLRNRSETCGLDELIKETLQP